MLFSQGPYFATGIANNNIVGAVEWTSPTNARFDDGSNASAAFTPGNLDSFYLHFTDFKFSVPTSASISGIIARVERQHAALTAIDKSIRLFKTGGVLGDDKAKLTAWTPAVPNVGVYGGSGDLWGATWTPSEINASGFGIGFSASGTATVTALVDYLSLEVVYDFGIVIASSVPLYTLGHIAMNSGVPLYLHGQTTGLSGNMNLFVKAPITPSFSGNLTLYVEAPLVSGAAGWGVSQGSTNLYMHARNFNSYLNLVVAGQDTQTPNSYMNLYLMGQSINTLSNSTNLFLSNSGVFSTVPLYVQGLSDTVYNNPWASGDGWYYHAAGMNLFLRRNPAESVNLFVQNTITTGTLPLFVGGAPSISSGVNLYLQTGYDIKNSNIELYTIGF